LISGSSTTWSKGRYCPDNGRPALDPTLLFKLLLIGYLFGVRSERQLIREVQVCTLTNRGEL
jgi:transposase